MSVSQRVPTGQLYRHYKGEYYELICIAAPEAQGGEIAVYRSQTGRIWCRPLTDFNEYVEDSKGEIVRRFELVFAYPHYKNAE